MKLTREQKVQIIKNFKAKVEYNEKPYLNSRDLESVIAPVVFGEYSDKNDAYFRSYCGLYLKDSYRDKISPIINHLLETGCISISKYGNAKVENKILNWKDVA